MHLSRENETKIGKITHSALGWLAGLSALQLHDLLPKVVKMVEEEEDGASAEPNYHGAICLMKNCQKAASSIT